METRVDRQKIFQTALDRFRRLAEQDPGNPLLGSAILQSEYLLALVQGEREDWARLNDISIGLITVREIEGRDDALADWIYEQVCPAVQQMRQESKTRLPDHTS